MVAPVSSVCSPPPPSRRESSRWCRRIPVFLILGLLTSGCSVRSLVVSSLAGSLTGLEDLYRSESDPELVRESLPGNLKLLDLLILQSPRDVDLLLAACQAYTTYGYAFVLRDAERVMEKDLTRWRRLRQRARNHFERAKGYALRALNVRHEGFSDRFAADPEAALQDLSREDVVFLYWLAASWANLISASRDDPAALVDLPRIGMLGERALELDERFEQGALHELMVAYYAGRPNRTADDLETARHHFQKALEESRGLRASLFVTYAESVSVRNQDREEFLDMLEKSLAVDVNRDPGSRLANLIAQERARWLKGRVDDLFY
ncbi:MAG: TRAP transporter TatT component family protein [Fidelibacterota bacterium]